MTLRSSELHEHDSTAGSGHVFQADATTRTTIPVNVTGFDPKSNLPIRTATVPTMPNTNGPYTIWIWHYERANGLLPSALTTAMRHVWLWFLSE